MATHQADSSSSVRIPLLADEKGYHLNDTKCEAIDAGNTSFFKTCFHCFNALSGIGLVSMPYTLASAGWLGLLLLFGIAMACHYSGILIQRCMIIDPGIKAFPDIGQRAFGNKGRLIVSIAMNSELYLTVVGFLILEGDNLNKLIPDVGLAGKGLTISGTTLFVIIAALVILPTVWLQDLSLLSYVSVSGALASTIFFVCLLWNATVDGTGFHGKGITPFKWSGIPTATSLYAFSYSGHTVFPTLYTSMRNKNQFSIVLFVCFTLCTLGYAATAILGYIMFGQEVQSQLTLNLAEGKFSSHLAIYTTLINPIAKYALMVTPVVNAAKSMLPCKYKTRRLTHLLVSTSLLISTVIVAVSVPLFGSLMTLVGALLSVSSSILVPCICYLKISGAYKKIFGFEMIINCAIILMGVAIGVVGTYTSLVEIAGHLQVAIGCQ